MYGFGKILCYSWCVQLTHNVIYYLLVYEKTCTTNKWLGDNFPYYVLNKQVAKLCCVHLGNYWHHLELYTTLSVFLIWIAYFDDFIFIVNGMAWESKVHRTKEWVFRDPVVLLPLEGNIVAAQNHQQLYTYHKWREI